MSINNRNKFTTIKERALVIADTQEVRKGDFFDKIGMTSANFRGKAVKTPLNSNAIENIISEYPQINLQWLVLGKGTMLNSYLNQEDTPQIVNDNVSEYRLRTDNSIKSQSIPLYNIDAAASLVELFRNHNDETAIDTISIPNLPKCDGAVYVTGDSMYPLLKSGDIVMYKEIHNILDGLFWGEMYLISMELDGEEYIAVKFIQKSENGSDWIKLVSQNSNHQPKDVLLSKVRALALIKASIRVNSMN